MSVDHQLELLASIGRQVAYAWTTDSDEISDDAIMVGISGTDIEMLTAGLSYVESTASISWCTRETARGTFLASGIQGPLDVQEALTQAHKLRILMGYERVVVLIDNEGRWRPEWGRLAEHEGLT